MERRRLREVIRSTLTAVADAPSPAEAEATLFTFADWVRRQTTVTVTGVEYEVDPLLEEAPDTTPSPSPVPSLSLVSR